MHRLLKRQIKQIYGKDYDIGEFDEKTLKLLDNVTETYQNFDEEKTFLNQTILENRRVIKEAYDNMLTRSRLAAIGEMMENITHQWKQPLSIILNIVAIMKLDMKDNRDLLTIEEQTKYLDNTIKDFTNFSSHSDDEKVVFDMAKSIEETIQIFDFQSKTHNIIIEKFCENNLYIQGDIGKFNQAILVIFSNAKDAFVSRGIENRSINIYTSVVENNIELHLQDNAGGIREDIIERIFEPYFTTKFKDKGTGIGLSMTYNIIQQMHGTIQARNSESGAEFIITLPRKHYKKDDDE
jgi:signal transduction histidine kinase